jgi:hypothetical protein
MAAAQRLRGHVQDGEMIGHEECVEFSGFELLRETRQMGEIEIGVRKGAGITPCARVETDGSHEGAEMQFAIICHWVSLSCRCFGADGSLSHPLQAQARFLLAATISPSGNWRGKDYSDYDFQTERFFPGSRLRRCNRRCRPVVAGG